MFNDGVVTRGDPVSIQFISFEEQCTPSYARIASDARIGCSTLEVFSHKIVNHVLLESVLVIEQVMFYANRFTHFFGVFHRLR